MRFNPGSYMYDMILFELKEIVGDDNVSISEADKISYSIDFYWISQMWHYRGEKCPVPDYIVLPDTTEEVSKILILANEYKIPVIVWGGGGGAQGGALPIYGGIILDMKKMNKVIDIDLNSMIVEVETGIIMQHLEWELEKFNVSTMHIPASIYCSTVGGFLAHRGTGVLSTKYGKLEDMIITMEVVLPDGKIMNTLPVPKNASGPDLNKLFIGSEGTLGVITKVKLAIREIPESREFRAFLFKDIHSGLEAGRKIIQSRLNPSVIRLYNETETKAEVKDVLGIDRNGAYMVCAFDGFKDVVKLQVKKAQEISKSENGEDLGSKLGQTWWVNKLNFYYPGKTLALPQAFGTCDTATTYNNIENLYWKMKNAIETNFPEARFKAHFSHWFDWGCMIYARFIFDNPPADPHQALYLYNKAWKIAVKTINENGGVLNEHHGTGLKLGRLFKELYGDSFYILDILKRNLDKNNIMNPGKMGLGEY